MTRRHLMRNLYNMVTCLRRCGVWIPAFAGITILLSTFNFVQAVRMDSPLYRLESASVTNAAGEKSSTNYKLSDTLGQLAAGEFSSTGYVIKAGFQYLHSIIPFRFSISSISINFGTLTPNSPQTATTTLTVSYGGVGSYAVTAVEVGPMTSLAGGNTIADTQCDGGASTCTESTAKPWTSSSAYGFGYNMAGQDIPSDFTDSTYYRPFPDRLAAESPSTVMSSSNVGKNRQSTVTFKVNISPVQAAGTYQTVINFVATPSY